MKHKLSKGKILHGEFISPDVVIAEFNNDFLESYQTQFVSTFNHGEQMLRLYKSVRDHLDITTVAEMLEDMEKIYNQWSYEMYKFTKE